MANVIQLRKKMYSLKKGSDLLINFIKKVKSIEDALLAAGDDNKDKDLVMSVLNGAGHEYDSVVVVISNKIGFTFLENAQYILLMQEQQLEELNDAFKTGLMRSIEQSELNFGRKGRNNGFRGRGRGRFNGRGQKIYFQICTKVGHGA